MKKELICPNCECDLYLAKWVDEPIGLAEEINFTVRCCDCNRQWIINYSVTDLKVQGGEE